MIAGRTNWGKDKVGRPELSKSIKNLGPFSLHLWPWLTAGLAAWLACRWILWSRRGFEFQDEGAYLLISRDPWNNSFSSFYGFVLHPLYLLCFQDPGWFRLISLAVLVAVAWGGAWIWCRREGLSAAPPSIRWGIVALFVSGALLVFSDGQRTPSYNTIVFVGAVLGWIGYMGLASGSATQTIYWIILGTGILLAFLAKWPAGFLLGLLFSVLVYKRRLYRHADGIALCVFFLLQGFVWYWWIGWQGVQNTLSAIDLLVSKGQSHGLQLLPHYGLTLINFFYRCGRAFAYGAPILLLLWILSRQRPVVFHRLARYGWLVPWMVLGGGLLFGLTRAGASSFSRVGSNVLAEIMWLLAVSLLLVPWRNWGRSGFRTDETLGLVLTPFLLGVGTNTALGDYTGHGVLFFQLAGLAIWRVLYRCGFPRGILASLLFLGSTLNLFRAEASLRDQFRTAPMAECIFPWISPGGGTVYLDAGQAELLRQVRPRLEAWGFRRGDPIIAIGDMPGLVYFLGGYSPGAAWYHANHSDDLNLALVETIKPEVRRRSFLIMNEQSSQFYLRKDFAGRLGVGRPVVLGPYQLDGVAQRIAIWPPKEREF